MRYSLITPYRPSETGQLHALKRNLENQTTQDFEWIIAGETPVDRTAAAWQTSLNLVQAPGQPTSIGAARNAALQAATGDFLVFIDSDDYLRPNALAELATVLTHHPATTLFDLNQYPTYEPHDAFVASHLTDAAPDDLPKWGGAKRRRHQQRMPVNLATMAVYPQRAQLTQPVVDWLQHRYIELTGEQRFDQISRQLKVTGKVVARKLVAQAHLIFDPTNPLYPDTRFMVGLLGHTTSYLRLSNPTYIRVKHNDPVNQPSVHQLADPLRWHQRVTAWQLALAAITPDDPVFAAFTGHTLRHLHRYLYAALATRTATVPTELVADLTALLQTYLQTIPVAMIQTNVSGRSRRILLRIRRTGTLPQHAINDLVRLRELNRIVRHRGRGITRLAYNWWFTKLPLRRRTIFYESFLGRNYSDSPKAIYEYLEKTYPGMFYHVWVMNPGVEPNPGKRPNTTVVKRFGWRYMYYLATAKYQVINMRQPQWFIKRPGTKFLATWHGTPLKHLVFDMDNVASANPLYKAIFYHQSRQWDYLVTANQFSVDVFSHAFMYPTAQMLPSGYPRNDLLSAPDRDVRARLIKEKLGIPLDKKVILYAPTWRDDDYYGVGAYKFTLKLDIARLRRELGDDYVLVLRTHYFITEHLDTTGFGDFVYNESSYNDISELYLISDVLITDYSSVFFDYAILRRPILYFVYDYEKYGSVLRGFYLNMQTDLPGPLLKTNDDVLAALHDLPAVTAKYAEAYEAFHQRFNAWEDGHASKRVVDAFFGDVLPDQSAPRELTTTK